MPKRPILILFVKVPRLGTVKTRLARALGEGEARLAYRRMSDPVIQRLSRDRRWRTILAKSPPSLTWRAWPKHVAQTGQAHGGLGDRMAFALKAMARPVAVIVGSDIPEISPDAVWEAFRNLRGADFVFGPATDGGYWLIGWRRFAAWPSRGLRRVRWSTRHALGDSLTSLGSRRITWCRTIPDVDELPDYLAWQERRSPPKHLCCSCDTQVRSG